MTTPPLRYRSLGNAPVPTTAAAAAAGAEVAAAGLQVASPAAVSGHLAAAQCEFAFTRYCRCQYCIVYGIQKGVGGGVVYCAIDVQ